MIGMGHHLERKSHHSVSWVALGVGVAILTASGMWYRAKAAGYAQYSSSIKIPVGTLAQLPTKLGEWEGKDVALSDNIVRRTATDDHVNRAYMRTRDKFPVSLFVGYGVRLRDLTPHRPEVCYPGAGWIQDEKTSARLKAPDGATIECQIFRFRRGGLSMQQIAVLDFYIVDGQYMATVTGLREKAAKMGQDRTDHYVAQIQVVCGDAGQTDATRQGIQDFASIAASRIQKIIEDAVAKQLGKSSAPAELNSSH